jgi:hypothetical protein
MVLGSAADDDDDDDDVETVVGLHPLTWRGGWRYSGRRGGCMG